MRMKLALAIYLIIGVINLNLGGTYLFAMQFLYYHAQAVGVPWQDLDSGVQVLIRVLMKLPAGGWFASGFFR